MDDNVHIPDSGLSFADREKQILQLLTKGESNEQIAQTLGISEVAVKASLKAIYRILHVQNRTQAAVWAFNHREALR